VGFILFNVDGEDNQLASSPELRYHDDDLCAVDRFAPNQVFRLFRFAVALSFPDGAFDIEDGQLVIIHFFVRMESHHILTATDFVAHSL